MAEDPTTFQLQSQNKALQNSISQLEDRLSQCMQQLAEQQKPRKGSVMEGTQLKDLQSENKLLQEQYWALEQRFIDAAQT